MQVRTQLEIFDGDKDKFRKFWNKFLKYVDDTLAPNEVKRCILMKHVSESDRRRIQTEPWHEKSYYRCKRNMETHYEYKGPNHIFNENGELIIDLEEDAPPENEHGWSLVKKGPVKRVNRHLLTLLDKYYDVPKTFPKFWRY